jgi:magnesium-transporting ATPase (P-type)
VLLLSSEESGKCNIETSDLDGETNLKQRWVLPRLHKQIEDTDGLDRFLNKHQGYVRCDAPNSNLEKFNGAVYIGDDDNEQNTPNLAQSFHSTLSVPGTSIENDNTVLRGCILRNAKFVVGLVVYVGNDTKMMMNTGKIRFKRTRVDMELDRLVLAVGGIVVLISLTGSVMCYCYIDYGQGRQFEQAYNWLYTEGETTWSNKRFENMAVESFLHFFSYLVVMNTMIPISLYVCVEMIRLGQSLMIDADIKMVDPVTGTYAMARTQSLNEELGQIDHVFSDKTGTLTQNVMTFRRCSIGGIIYGASMDEIEEFHTPGSTPMSSRPNTAGSIGSSNSSKGSRPTTSGGRAIKQVNINLGEELTAALGTQAVSTFFTLISVCHTATVDRDEVTGAFEEYASESPDEKALLDAARAGGAAFVDATNVQMTVEIAGVEQHYAILDLIKFNSTRKRMTIVCRCPDKLIRVFSKGADNVMLERLPKSSVGAREQLSKELETFAHEGLRTLVMAQKVISEEEWAVWHKEYAEASAAVFEREEKMDVVADKMERELDLVGCSAIEDKLQDGVPETIKAILSAGIKIWVLTGDKVETAVNIGSSASLLTAEMEPYFIVDAVSQTEALEQLQSALDSISFRSQKVGDDGEIPKFALVVTGSSLSIILPPSKKELETIDIMGERAWTEEMIKAQKKLETNFLRVARRCASVVCCRVSPLQKAKVVELVKTREKTVTLAIGDGANDVSMIRAAHIGVGISGLEGRQAVLSSDFSFAQFRFLKRLLFLHGRWSYYRMSRFVRYFFYKSFAFTICAQFFFAFYNLSSAQTIVDAFTVSMYNVLFTAIPIIVVGLVEQDVDEATSLKYPILYGAGPRQLYFSSRITFLKDMTRGLLHALCGFFFVIYALEKGGQIDEEGQDQGDLNTLSITLTFALITLINAQLALDSTYFTWLHVCWLLYGPMSWLTIIGALSAWDDSFGYEFVYIGHGAVGRQIGEPKFWLIFCLVIYGGLMPNLYGKLYREYFHPNPVDMVRRGKGQELKDMIENMPIRGGLGVTRLSTAL